MTATFTERPIDPSGFTDEIDERVDDEFALGAARYLRNSGLSTEAIAASLVGELDLDVEAATRYAIAA